jgi:hypothetical protein
MPEEYRLPWTSGQPAGEPRSKSKRLDKIKYWCPVCTFALWGKAGGRVACMTCDEPMISELDPEPRRRAEPKRSPPPPPPPEGLAGIVKKWFSELALKYHPDRGGTDDAMAALNDALERLRTALHLEDAR